MNGLRLIATVQALGWAVLAGALWTGFQGGAGSVRAAIMTAAVVAISAAALYSAVFLQAQRAIRPSRWVWIVGSTGVWAGVGHVVFDAVGLRQSVGQDLINVTTVTGVGLALRLAWTGYRAQQEERALRQDAERRLSASRLRPTGKLAVKVGHGDVLLEPDQIHYLMASGNFSEVHGEGGATFASESLKELTAKLEPYGFKRIHKSYVVNPRHIKHRRIDGVTLSSGEIIPIGRAYRRAP